MVFKRRDRPSLFSRMREAFYPRRGWRRAIEYIGHRVKRLPDTPHRIALGFACGAFASFTPLFGLHFILAAVLAWVFRANILAALIGTAVGNPLTFPLIASLSLGIGRRVLGYGATGRDYGRVTDAIGEGIAGLWRSLLSVIGFGEGEWDRLLPLYQDVIVPYLVGGIGPGLLVATASYYLARPIIAAYQVRRRARLRAKTRRRLRLGKTEADGAG